MAGKQVKKNSDLEKQQEANQNTQEEAFANQECDCEKLQAEIGKLNQKLKESEERSLRISADMQNLSKQHELDLAQAKKSGKKATAATILGFLNTLNISFSYIPATDDEKVLSFINTLKNSFEKLIGELKVINVELILPEIGGDFDGEIMGALNEPSGDEAKIKNVVNLGLKIDGQVIQPASVMF